MNNMKRLRILLPPFAFGIVAFGGLCPADAQGAGLSSHAGRPPMEIIKAFDSDNDHRIGREELRFRSISVFDEIDESKDGMPSPAALPGLSAATFKATDKDKDGLITAAEISAFQSREKSR
jgi:hypothetical protein